MTKYKFEIVCNDLTLEFRDTLRTMCEIFDDHTLPDLPEWIEEALRELTIRR